MAANKLGKLNRAKRRHDLRIEQLETRSLLTAATFTVNLYTDAGGVPGEVIIGDAVHVGDTFFVEIMAEDVRVGAIPADMRGLKGIALDVDWNAGVFRSLDDPLAPGELLNEKLSGFQRGQMDQSRGEIDNLNGVVGDITESVGRDGPERFALLHFEALSIATSSLGLNVGRSQIAFLPPTRTTLFDFEFERQVITVLPALESSPANSPANLPAELAPTDDLDDIIQAATSPVPVMAGTQVEAPTVPMHLCEVVTAAPVPSLAPTAEPLAAVPVALASEVAAKPAAAESVVTAVDEVFATSSTEELLSGTKQVHVDSALIQALVFGLAMKNSANSLDLSEDTSG